MRIFSFLLTQMEALLKVTIRVRYKGELYPVYAIKFDEDTTKVLLGDYRSSKTVKLSDVTLYQDLGTLEIINQNGELYG